MRLPHSCALKAVIRFSIQSLIYNSQCRSWRRNPTSLKRTHAMLFSTLMQTYGDWRRFNANLRELSHLSDRELADLGITRADIYRLAWDNARKAA
jgi:uncharacterized protein YjiS (DUF1127 family)